MDPVNRLNTTNYAFANNDKKADQIESQNPIIGSLKTKKIKNKVKRNAFTAPQIPTPQIEPMMNNIVQSSSNLISFSQLPLSSDACETLEKVARSIQLSYSIPLVENLIHYIHIQLTLLDQEQTQSLRSPVVEKLLPTIKTSISYLGFLALAFILKMFISFDDKIFEYKNFFPSFEEKYPDIFKFTVGLKNIVETPESKTLFLSRFKKMRGNYTNKFDIAKSNFLIPLNEISAALRCLLEILNLPKDILIKHTENEVSKTLRWPASTSVVPFQKEMGSYIDCTLNMFTAAKSNGLGNFFLQEIHLKSFFSNLLNLADTSNETENTFFKKIDSIQSSSTELKDMLNLSKQIYLDAKAGSLSYDQFTKNYNVINRSPPKTHEEFVARCASSYHFNGIFWLLTDSPLETAGKEASKKLNHTPLCHINLEVISFNLKEINKDKEFLVEIISLVDIFRDHLKMFIQDPHILEQFNQLLEKIYCLKESIETDEQSSLTMLDKMLTDLCYPDYLKLKNHFTILFKNISVCEEFMHSFNVSLQKGINHSSCSIDDLQQLEQSLSLLKAKLSEFLHPLLQLPLFFNDLITINQKKHLRKSFEIDVSNTEVPDLLKVNFTSMYQKTIKLEQAPIPKNELPIILPQKNSEPSVITPKKQSVPQINQKKPPQKIVNTSAKKPVAIEKDEEKPLVSNKLGQLIQYISEKGWAPKSVCGSHVKFELNNRTLIVPINKPNLKEGTLKAILKQENEKRNANNTALIKK